MNSSSVCLFVILAFTICSSYGELVSQSCPSTGSQNNFNITQYLGKWYEYQRFTAWFELGVVCGSAEYGMNDDGSLSVVNGGHRNIFGFKVPTSITGKATIPNKDKPSELIVAFSRFQPTDGPANYFVVETDYTGYTVVFSCSDLPGTLSIQYAWIMTRERGSIAQATLNGIRGRLQAQGVQLSHFNSVDQSDCDTA